MIGGAVCMNGCRRAGGTCIQILYPFRSFYENFLQSRAAAMQQQIMNGYQVGKLVRASTLHQSIMTMTQPDLDNGQRPGQENAKLYVVTSMPESLSASKQETITLDADYVGNDR